MLSSTKSRRILHVISVSLAIVVFGYGLFLKLTKEEPIEENVQKRELVKNDLDSQQDLEIASPN